MKIFDPKITHSLKKYIFQSALATLSICFVLIFMDILEHTALIATLGASAFIIFVMPHSYISMPRQVLGGYIVCIICGCICCFSMTGLSHLWSVLPGKVFLIGFGALAVGVAIFLMAVIDFEHPPAVGVSLGLVLNPWNYKTVIFILFAVIIMLGVKKLFKPVLIDLI